MTITTWRDTFRVNTTTTGRQDDADVVALADGGFVIAWEDGFSGSERISGQIYNADGTRQGGELALAHDYVEAVDPSLAATPDGAFFLSFNYDDGSNEGVRIRSFDSDGTTLGTSLTTTATPVFGADTDLEATDGLVVQALSFIRVSDADILGAVWSWNGSSFTSVESVFPNLTTTGSQIEADVAILEDGGYAFVWRDGNLVELVVLNADLSHRSGFDVTVADTGNIFFNPEVTALANGGFVVSYARDNNNDFPADSFDVYARIYAPNGFAFGSEILVNSNTPGEEFYPVITPLNDGGFAAFWLDNTGTDSVRGQLFDSVGNRRGAEFIVETGVGTEFDSFDATTLSDGRIVVTFAMDQVPGGGGDTGIGAKILDPRGGLIQGTDEGDTLHGGHTADQIDGFIGDDTVFAGAGDDQADGGAGNDVLHGDTGNDILGGGVSGDDVLYGGEGDDTLIGQSGADALFGGTGTDTADYSGSFAGVDVGLWRTGTGGDSTGDVLRGIERIIGSDFADTIIGVTGTDGILEGGRGADFIWDYAGSSSLYGGDDDDSIYGGIGDDLLVGGAGADSLNGGAGIDTADYSASLAGVNVGFYRKGSGGDSAGDTMTGVERIIGTSFDDTMVGGGTIDGILEGGDGNDFLYDYVGDSFLYGGGGVDNINGGGGDDTIEGGGGNDILLGGTGADVFLYTGQDYGRDLIYDWEVGVDKISLAGSGLTYADFTKNDTPQGTRFDRPDGTAIHLLGIDPNDVGALDFI